MELKTCARCGRIFNTAGSRICPQCRKKEEDYFERVKEYLREYPGAELIVVSAETNVSVTIIKKFIREGRIEISKESPITIPCQRCGAPIRVGKYCSGCSTNLQSELKKVSEGFVKDKQKTKQASEKMRYFTRDH